MNIGILALQGDYFAHSRALNKLGYRYSYIKNPEELSLVDSLIIPGGESSTIRKLAIANGIWEHLKKFDKPMMGTCAGIILLAQKIESSPEEVLNRLNITISRNAYGSQINSFTADGKLLKTGKTSEFVFIRGPKISEIGNEVEILAEYKGKPVAVKQNNVIGATFHPELADDTTVYEHFLNLMIRKSTESVQVF